MPSPDGSLTAIQHEIMEVVWESKDQGAMSSEIWQSIAKQRSVVRTTILNQVDRLEKRGWLRRDTVDGNLRYFANMDRVTTEKRLATQFVNDYFRGSVSQLVSRLFGSQTLSEQDLREMQKLIDELPDQRSDDTGLDDNDLEDSQ